MRTIAVLSALVLTLAGCSLLEGKKIDYKSAGSLPPLEAPPDLVLPGADNRFALPEASAVKGPATYSAYNQGRGARPVAGTASVLPRVDKVRAERDGNQRWLVVGMAPKDVWPVVKDFWQELGFIINLELPEAGVMETDWAENRAKIPQDALRSFLGRVFDSLYSTAERDKFRTRLESTVDGMATEVFISHRGMVEVYEGTQGGGDQGQGRTVWQPRAADPELEAEMLRRLMVRFGVEDAHAQTLLAAKAAPPRASVQKAPDGAPGLMLPESFDRAWRRVGLALDRIGFAVEDRDRAEGVYYVRYVDPEAAGAKEKRGLLSKLAFWRDDDKPQNERFRIRVNGRGEASEVAVYLEAGAPAATPTGERIVRLLHEQLK